MNFKVRDTAWFVGVGASVLSFMIGLFSGFFLSGVPIFFVNMLLFMIGSVTIISGAGLLLAAAELYAKVHDFKASPLIQAHSNLYSVAVGEDRDSMKAHEVLGSLVEDQSVPKDKKKKELEETAAISIIDYPTEKEEVFDLETSHSKFADEEINPTPLTKTELLAKIDSVQEFIAHQKDAHKEDSSENPADLRIIHIDYPKSKPTIHENLQAFESDTALIEEVDVPEVAVSTESPILEDITGEPVETPEIIVSTESPALEEVPASLKNKAEADLRKIILIGGKGIDPTSEKFKLLLERAYEVEDEDFVLRLKGKTFGLGARGVRVERKNTSFTKFNKSDISKMLKKFN